MLSSVIDPSLQNSVDAIENTIDASRWLSPLNLADEREKFLKDSHTNPHFVYPDFDKIALQKQLDLLNTFDVQNTDSLESWILKRKIEYLKLELSLFLQLNTDQYSSITCQLYQCSFTADFLEKARVDAASPLPFISTENKTPAQIIEGIKNYLAGYGIFDWNIALSEETDFYFRVRANKKQIFIGKQFNWDFCDFDNMLAHEIDGHVVRAINASKQTSVLLKKPLPFYIKTEEGLASFLGDYCSTTSEICRKHHALKYLAGDLARTHSFTEVFEFLLSSGFTPDLAFQRTFRLKRGIANTRVPGLFAKEAMYYPGMLEVKDYLDNGQSVHTLYSGKVGLEDSDYVTVPNDIVIPKRLELYLSGHVR